MIKIGLMTNISKECALPPLHIYPLIGFAQITWVAMDDLKSQKSSKSWKIDTLAHTDSVDIFLKEKYLYYEMNMMLEYV